MEANCFHQPRIAGKHASCGLQLGVRLQWSSHENIHSMLWLFTWATTKRIIKVPSLGFSCHPNRTDPSADAHCNPFSCNLEQAQTYQDYAYWDFPRQGVRKTVTIGTPLFYTFHFCAKSCVQEVSGVQKRTLWLFKLLVCFVASS